MSGLRNPLAGEDTGARCADSALLNRLILKARRERTSPRREALSRAKADKGPTLLECVTYRLSLHTTADDPSKYRSKAEEAEWRKRDPIPRFCAYLKGKGLWDDAWQATLEKEVEAEVRQAVEAAEGNRDFDPADMFDYVFATKPPSLKAQQEEMRAALHHGRDVADG